MRKDGEACRIVKRVCMDVLGGVEKPDVDLISEASPSISIDRRQRSNLHPRSTVGTVREIYDYLRLCMRVMGVPYCPVHNEPIVS